MRLAAALVIALVPAAATHAQVSYTTIARTGDPIPNTGGQTALGFLPPITNNDGLIASTVRYDPSAFRLAPTLFPSPGTYVPIALPGTTAPGTIDGAPFANALGPLTLNNTGQLSFNTRLTTSSLLNDEALFTTPSLASATPVSMYLTAREGSQAPGLPTNVVYARVGVDNQAFAPQALSHSGQTVFVAGLAGPDVTAATNKGLFAGSPAAPDLILRQGTPAPHPGFVFSFNSSALLRPVINPAGQIAFRSSLTSGSVTYQNAGLFLLTPPASGQGAYTIGQLGSLREDAPGTSFGFAGFSEPSLNPAGYAAFTATLTSSAPQQVLYLGKPDALSIVAKTNDGAPGTALSFNAFSAPLLAANNAVAFTASLLTTDGAENTGLWIGTPGKVKLLAREGQPTPAGPDTFFGDLAAAKFSVNSHGQVVFAAPLTGPAVVPATSQALFGTDRAGRIVLLSRYGQSYDAGDGPAPGTWHAQLGSNSDDALPSAFNDRGEFVFGLSLSTPTPTATEALVRAAIPLPGDATRDGVVDTTDFTRLILHYGQSGDQTQGDFNYDSRIDFADFQILEQWFRTTLDGPAPTPEPLPAELLAFAQSIPEPALTLLPLLLALTTRRRHNPVARAPRP